MIFDPVFGSGLGAAPMPDDPSRLVPLEGTFNFRDVGGYPVAAGGTLRHGRLYRSDALSELSDADLETLGEIGLGAVLDLRETYEWKASPDRVEGLNADQRYVPVFADSLFADGFDHITEPITLPKLYDMMVSDHAEQLALAVTNLSETISAPSVVHCTAGKDRTGMVTALTLSALGVPEQWVVRDFAATESFLGEAFVARVKQHYARNGFPASMASNPTLAPAELMVAMLARIREEHGGAERFLIDHGTPSSALDALRRELVVGAA